MPDDTIIQKLQEHDARFDKVDERFKQIDERFRQVDARFDKVDERFKQVDARFDKVDERLDKLTIIVLEHGERFDTMVTKKEFNEFRSEQTIANDKIITILNRLDEERFATIGWLRRIEDEVEEQKKKTLEHELMLQRIRKELNLSVS